MIGLLVPSDPHVVERGPVRRPGSFLPLGTVRLVADLDAPPERAVCHPAQATALAFRPEVGTMGASTSRNASSASP